MSKTFKQLNNVKEKGAKKLEDIDEVSADPTAKAEEYKKLYPDIIEIIVNDKNEKGKTVGYKIYNSINTKYWMNFDQDDYCSFFLFSFILAF